MPTTYQGVLETQRGHDFASFSVRQVDPKIHLLQSEIAPITTIMMNMVKGEKAKQVKVEWPERELLPHTTRINNGAGYNNAVLSFIIDNIDYVKIGDFLRFQRTGEVAGFVSAKNTGTSTVTVNARGVLGAAAALLDNDIIIIMRGNIPEGGAAAEALVTQPVMKFNYIEPTSTTFKVTDILEESQQYANANKLSELRALKMKDHMEDLEKKIIYGVRGLDTSGNETRYFMGGLLYYLTTTIESISVGIGGTKGFSQRQWERFITRLFNYNQSSARKQVFCSAEILSQISEFKYQAVQLRPDDMMINVAAMSYRSSFGIVDLIHQRFLNSEFGTDWHALGLDMKKIIWMPYENQVVRENIQEKRFHRREDEIYVSGTMEVMNEPVHGVFRVIE